MTPVAPLTPAACLHNELVYAHRKASQLKLHPYQHNAIEEFVKVMYHFQQLAYVQIFAHNLSLQSSSVLKQISLFIQLCTVENMVSTINLMAAPPFVSSPQLLVNRSTMSIPVSDCLL